MDLPQEGGSPLLHAVGVFYEDTGNYYGVFCFSHNHAVFLTTMQCISFLLPFLNYINKINDSTNGGGGGVDDIR